MSTRDDILRAARALLAEGGFRALTMRAVAARVGVSATALYRHYASKEALLAAAVSDGGELLRRYLARALRAPTPAQRLRRTGEQYLAFAFAHPDHYRLLFLAWEDLVALGVPRPPPGQLSGGLQFLVDRVLECRAEGLLPPGDDPFPVAIQCWALVHGLASLWLTGGGRGQMSAPQWRRLSRAVLERALAGVFAAAAPGGAAPARRDRRPT